MADDLVKGKSFIVKAIIELFEALFTSSLTVGMTEALRSKLHAAGVSPDIIKEIHNEFRGRAWFSSQNVRNYGQALVTLAFMNMADIQQFLPTASFVGLDASIRITTWLAGLPEWQRKLFQTTIGEQFSDIFATMEQGTQDAAQVLADTERKIASILLPLAMCGPTGVAAEQARTTYAMGMGWITEQPPILETVRQGAKNTWQNLRDAFSIEDVRWSELETELVRQKSKNSEFTNFGIAAPYPTAMNDILLLKNLKMQRDTNREATRKNQPLPHANVNAQFDALDTSVWTRKQW